TRAHAAGGAGATPNRRAPGRGGPEPRQPADARRLPRGPRPPSPAVRDRHARAASQSLQPRDAGPVPGAGRIRRDRNRGRSLRPESGQARPRRVRRPLVVADRAAHDGRHGRLGKEDRMTPADRSPGLEATRPPDRMIADRLRTSVRAAWLVARAGVLNAAGLFRHRERRPPAPGRVARLLVIRTDRIGDMTLTTPALQDLRAHFRKAEITVLAPAVPLEVLRGHPAVDRLVALERRGLPPEMIGRFDLTIDMTPDENLR